MHSLRSLVLLAALVFIFPVTALSGEDEAEVALEEGIVEPSEAHTVNSGFLKDERLLVLEQEYAAYYEELSAEIQDESDPLGREQLQEEVQALKEEGEIKLKERQLDIAMERGDVDQALKLQEALDSLYWHRLAEPVAQKARKAPAFGSKKPKARFKNPDDN